jgi:hypothetical protein
MVVRFHEQHRAALMYEVVTLSAQPEQIVRLIAAA